MSAPVVSGYLSSLPLAGLMLVVGLVVVGFLLWSLRPGGSAERRRSEKDDAPS